MIDNEEAPLVTICLPLFRAARWVDNICAGIESRTYPNLEFLISDQHCYDDAIDQLRSRFGDDPRFRFFVSTEELEWWQNFNLLAERAGGRYFRWLAQDNGLEPGSLGAAVERLESAPDAVLTYGPIDIVNAAGETITRGRADIRRAFGEDEPWTWFEKMATFARWRHRGANQGLFRTAVFRRAKLALKKTPEGQGSPSLALMFALSLRGRFCYEPRYRQPVRFHAASFSAQRRLKAGDFLSYAKTGIRHWREYNESRWSLLVMAPALMALGAIVAPAIYHAYRFSDGGRAALAIRRTD